MKVHSVSTSADLGALVSQHPRVLVEVGAPWCGPCRQIKPVLESLDGVGGLKVVLVDTDASPKLAEELGIMGLPVLFFYRDGSQVHRHNGAAPRRKLEMLLAEHLA